MTGVLQVYCDMTGGRWNELLRRGADAEKAAIPAGDELSFAGPPTDATTYQGLHGDLLKEFFVGEFRPASVCRIRPFQALRFSSRPGGLPL